MKAGTIFFFFVILMYLVYGLVMSVGVVLFEPAHELTIINYDKAFAMGCETDSMGLALRCESNVYTREVTPDEPIITGDIYVYIQDNQSIVHRAVLCLDNCTFVIMKGDNNDYAEKVDRTDIKYHVEAIEY